MFNDTAFLAGGDKRVKQWSGVRVSVIKLKVLVKLYKSMMDLGFGSTLDEKLASDRTRRHLNGPLDLHFGPQKGQKSVKSSKMAAQGQ